MHFKNQMIRSTALITALTLSEAVELQAEAEIEWGWFGGIVD